MSTSINHICHAVWLPFSTHRIIFRSTQVWTYIAFITTYTNPHQNTLHSRNRDKPISVVQSTCLRDNLTFDVSCRHPPCFEAPGILTICFVCQNENKKQIPPCQYFSFGIIIITTNIDITCQYFSFGIIIITTNYGSIIVYWSPLLPAKDCFLRPFLLSSFLSTLFLF